MAVFTGRITVTYYASIFAGSGIQLDASNNIIAGTVNEYVEAVWNGSDWLPLWGVADFSTSASALYQAFLTPSTADDFATIRSVLSGNDVFSTGAGNDILDGGPGIDIALYSGLRSQYQFEQLSNGSFQVTDLRNGSPDGTDTVSNVELFQFADGTFAPVVAAIETQGSTSLSQAGGHFFLYGSLGSGPSLKFAGADFVDGQFGGWAPIGAEKTATGYEVAWKDAGTGLYTAWNTDNNGNYVSI